MHRDRFDFGPLAEVEGKEMLACRPCGAEARAQAQDALLDVANKTPLSGAATLGMKYSCRQDFV